MHDRLDGPLLSGDTPLSTFTENPIVNRNAIGLLLPSDGDGPARMMPAIRSFQRPASVPDLATIIGRIQKRSRPRHNLHRRAGKAGSGAD